MKINENEFNWVETGKKKLYPSKPDGNKWNEVETGKKRSENERDGKP